MLIMSLCNRLDLLLHNGPLLAAEDSADTTWNHNDDCLLQGGPMCNALSSASKHLYIIGMGRQYTATLLHCDKPFAAS